MNKSILNSIYAIGIAIFLTSCATLISGTKQNISITSNPDGANVYTAKLAHPIVTEAAQLKLENVKDKWLIGTTPLSTKVDRNTHLIFVQKEGFSDTLLYYINPMARIKIVDASSGKTVKKKIKPAKYHSRTNLVTFGNIVLGGLVGIIVDGATGAILRMDNNMDVTLNPMDKKTDVTLNPMDKKTDPK